MKKLILLLALTPILCYSQVGLPYEIHALWNDYHLEKIKDGQNAVNYEGSPYLHDHFLKGQILLEDGQLIKNVPLRYNVFTDNFEIEKEGLAYNIPIERAFKKFTYSNDDFIYGNYTEGNSKKSGYLIPRFNLKCSLYKHHKVILLHAKKAEAFKKAEPAKFITKPPVFMITFNDHPPKVFKNHKQFIKLLPNMQKEMTKYINANKLKLKEETEIIQALVYYNTL